MKKLLSICILSVLLTMMSFFTAQAQSSNQCCFWVENMQPETFPHIANLDGSGIAQDTSAGMDLVLNNVLNRAWIGNTDVYTIHFPTGANCGDKVSIEWLLYRDGQLVNGNLSDYADFAIYTRYAPLNAAGYCQNIDWLGGIVENGDGICGCSIACNDQNDYYGCDNVDGHNDFPGARIANALTPPFHDMEHLAAGYTNTMYTYNFDYFYLPFLASDQSSTQIRITWKQVGNYSLVVRLRQRLGGTDYTFTYDGSQNPNMYIGGHQSCCGAILAQDSLHYLVTTAHEKSICDGETFMYGRGAETPSGSTLYAFTEESLYYVLFGDYECDHWKVEYIDTLQLYTRINPNIIAKDTNLCRDENFTAADLLNLVTEVDLDAPGIIGHEIQWSENNVTWSTDMSKLTSLNNMTVVAGVYTFYVRQINFYYDAFTGDTIGCGGDIDTIEVNVRDLFPPVLNGSHTYYFCNEVLSANTPLVLTAHLDDLDECSTEIRWYTEDDMALPSHSSTYFVVSGDTMEVDLTALNPENTDFRITYYLYAYNENTGTYSVGYDSVTIQLWQTPEFIVENTQLDFVVCPGAEVTMVSNITSEEPTYNGEAPTVTYAWYKNNVLLTNVTTPNFTVNASNICNDVDTYKVVVAAVSYVGCHNDTVRTFTVTARDIEKPVIAWINTVGTFDTLGNKTETLSGCDSSDVPAPYTVAQFEAVGTITDGCNNVDTLLYTDVALHTVCQTIVTRTYIARDACGNLSDPIVQIFTINNDFKPIIQGLVDIDPVRPLHNDCKEDAPDYATLRAIFDTTIHVIYPCIETTIDTVVFYLENTDVVADGNQDIFADTDLVTIYAVVTDICGNVSLKTPVFQIHEPAPMYIVHGAITLDTLELCADTNTNMHFNDNFVMNAGRPYEYQWSQISVVGQSIIAPDPNNYLEAVVSPVDQMINTSTHFVMIVTDVYGCVASDTANAIHFYRLPDVMITDHPSNAGYPHADGDTVCPNYGNFYVVANGHSNLPDSIPNYQELGFYWSGAAISLNPYTNTNLFKLACENCDTSYTPIVTVTNKKNCSATAAYTIYAYDGEAPVITAIDTLVRDLVPGRPCEIMIPDFVGNNLYFNPSTVSDNCFSVSEMTFTQDVPAGTFVNHDTIVNIHVHTPCGPDADHQILVRLPDNTIKITGITASPDSACEPMTTTLTPTIINSVGTITYNWSDNTHNPTTQVVATYANHTYSLSVTDELGCAHSYTFEPTVYRVPVAADFAFNLTPNTYCGDIEGDGTVGITVLNDSTAHIAGYSMTGDTHFPYRPVSYVYEDLTAGTYTFTVYTTDGCSAPFTATVLTDTTDPNAPFILTVLHHNYRCTEPYAGSVQVVPQQENYVYTIISDTHVTDGETQTGMASVITPLMFNWLYQDTYRVYVTSPKHCHFLTDPVQVLNETDTPTVHQIAIDTVTDCITPNGVLYIYNTNPTYTYLVNGILRPGNNGTLIYAGLSEGDYAIKITSSGNCVFYQNFHMESNTPGPQRPVATVNPDNYCYGVGANGSIVISAENTHAGYTYTIAGYPTQIAGPGSVVQFNNLPAGTYNMVVVDDHHCTTNYDYIVAADPIVVTFAPNEITAVNGNNCTVPNNQIIINAETGYDYVVTDVATGDTILPTDYNQLIDGSYLVHKVHSTYGCDHDTTVNVNTVKPVYNYTVNVTNDEDCSVLGTGVIAVNNPSADYTYTLHTTTAPSSVVVLSEDFSGFASATVGSTDISSNLNTYTTVPGWTGSKVYESDGNAKLGSASTLGYIQTPALDLSGNGGQFVITFDAKAWTGDNTNLKVSVGDRTFTVTGMTDTEFNTFTIPMTGGTTSSKVKFEGYQNSKSRFYLDNVVISYEQPAVVDLSDATLVPGTTPFDSLNAGHYIVVATNNTTNCEYLVNATVELDPYYPVPSAVSTANIMCIEPKSGTITVTLDSIVPATYYVQLDGTTTTIQNNNGLFTQLNSGLYHFYVESALHCQSFDGTINVVDSAFINPHFTITPNHSCDSTLNMPGTGCIYVDDPHDDLIHNYTYYLTLPGAWMDHDIDRPSYKWCALSDNWYKVDIIDNVTGCEWHDSLYVPFEAVNVTMTPEVTNNNNCVGTGNGTLHVLAVSDNLDSQLEFSIDGGTTWYANDATITGLSAGAYTIIVRDTYFNCTFDTLFNKDINVELEKKHLNIDYTVVNNTACDSLLYNGSITINSVKYDDNTVVNYTATITGDSWTNLGADNYTITVTDNATGCDTTFVVPITTENVCAPVISITSNGHNNHGDYYFCYGQDDGKLIAEATSTCDTDFNYQWTSVCAHASSNTADVDVYTDETFCCWYYVKATGVTTGCANVDSFYVCIDTLPIIHFLATGPSIVLTSGSLTPMAGDPNRPTPNFHNCENAEFTFGIVDPGFDSIIWANGYVDTNVATFVVPAYSLTPDPDAPVSYCVWVQDHNGCEAGYTAANVYTLPVPTSTVDTASCGTFDYITQSGIVYHYDFDATGTNTYTIIDTFAAVNGCDSIVTKNVTVNAVPTVTATGTLTQYCDGDIVPLTLTAEYENTYGMKLSDTDVEADFDIASDETFDYTAGVERRMNGKYVYAFAENACDTVYQLIGILFVDSLPVVSVSGTPEFCANSDITPTLTGTVLNWNCTTPGSTYWLVNATADTNGATVITKVNTENNDQYIFFAATNHCGTSVAGPLQLTVHTVEAPTLALAVTPTTFCAGEPIELSDITITHNTTATALDTNYTLGGTAYTLGTPLTYADNGKELVASVRYDCGSAIASNPITIVVNDTADLIVPTTNDTLCIAGGAYTFTVTMNEGNTITATVNNNKATVELAVNSGSSVDVTVTPVAVGDITVTITSTAAGNCGVKTANIDFFVGQKPVITGTVADLDVCVGSYLSLTAPAFTANGNIHAQGWKLNGTEFDPATTMMTLAHNGATLNYFVENICGETLSADATINVYDTAKLIVNNSVDTLCVGSSFTYTIDTNATNIVTITPSSNITYTHTGANVVVEAVSTGTATLTIKSNGQNNCGEKEVTVNFEVSDKADIDDITAPAAVCEGEVLALTVPTYDDGNSTIHSEGWEVKKSGETAFAAFDPTTKMTSSHNGAELRYMVETFCGKAYSNTVTITVNDTAKLTAPAEATQTVCNNTAITNIVMTTNKPLELSSELTAAGLSVSGNTISGTVAIAATESFPYTLTGTVSTVSTDCPAYDKTETITITVNEKPVVTLTAPDVVCDGANISSTFTVNNRGAAITSQGYEISATTSMLGLYNAWTAAPTATVADHDHYIYYSATNACGTSTSDTFQLKVAGHATVVIDASMFRDTCANNPFSDFLIGEPTVTLATDATIALDTFWLKKVGTTYSPIDLTDAIADPTSVVCVIETQCFKDTSNVVDLTFDKAPEFDPATPFTVADFTVCEGTPFTDPGLAVGSGIIANTDGAVTLTWTIDGATLDFSTAYDHATYDGKEIKLVVSNDCGSVEHAVNAVIYELPVPEMLKDTMVCADAANTFTLSVANEHSTSTYEWFGSDDVSVGTTATLTLPAGTVDTIMTFYVVETDEHNCKSITQVNVSPDTIASDLITVRVTDKPIFRFFSMAGVETHDINSSLSNETTAYKWTIDDKCYADSDTKVYVTFSIFYNGTLIPDDQISNYIETASYSDLYGSHSWNTSQYVEYISHSGASLNDRAYYTHMSNHYPTTNLNGAAYDFDWFYLHFLTSRQFTNTIATFLQEGDYSVHYYLISTDGSLIDYRYRQDGGASEHIGGRMFTGPIDTLAYDVFNIHVVSASTVAENEDPQIPIVDPIADEPTVKLYPNPTSENVNVRIEGLTGNSVVKITTLTGKTVAQKSINIDNSKRAIETFNVSELAPGVYVLQIINDNAIISRKLVITK